MKYFFSFLFSPFLLNIIFPTAIYGQEDNSFNLNIDNGLPTNHIYGAITDRHGYLWIATPNGVVRYNGYELKLFNLSEGLPNEDIWEVIEDRKGRIWLGNISDEMGYIYNDTYHKAFLKGFNRTMYPKDIRAFGNSIIFHCDYDNNSQQPTISIENNDTIFKYSIPESLFGSSVHSTGQDIQNLTKWKNKFQLISVVSNQKGEPLLIYKNCLYKLVIQSGTFNVKKMCDYSNAAIPLPSSDYKKFIISKNLISYNVFKSSKFLSTSIFSPKTEEIDIRKWTNDSNIYLMYYEKTDSTDKKFYIFADKNILQFESRDTINYVKSYSIKDLISVDLSGSLLTTFNQDNFWGNVIGTTTSGLWINYKTKDNIVKNDKIDLYNYKCLGGIQDSIYFWWDNANVTLAKIDKYKRISYRKYEGLKNLHNICHYNKDTFILTGHDTYFLNNRTGDITKIDLAKFGANIFSTIAITHNDLFMITSLACYSVKIDNEVISRHYIDWDRYNGLTYDSLRKQIWAYNYDKILIHKNNTDSIISGKKILKFGIKKIVKIVVDNQYGNIFFKGQNNITMYNYDNNSYTNILENYNTKDAIIDICKGDLIVAGHFGVIFYKIIGKGKLSNHFTYLNIKSKSYNYIYDYQVSSKEILLNTDRGTYQVKVPSDSEILNRNNDSSLYKYKFILYYKDIVSNIKSGDSVFINQKNLRLQFDIINPYGNGQIKYTYKLSTDSIWHELNANELTLPLLPPDKYYTLSVVANDNAWRSDQMELNLYIEPYWWQTNTGRRLIWVSVIVFIAILFTSSILITRKLVLKATKKRNLQMELELKSIYAQINPHFIFNTLNSALLLVRKNKMEEAYAHISKFSTLLRGYLKSSRNKLITISEEIINLKNYIELQQARFKNKFDYEISVDKTIIQDKIKIPSLLLQPFVENAINHGILNKQLTGHLKITFMALEKENEIICIIEDDGIGRKQSKYLNRDNKEESYGDLLIKDLVSIFNKYEQMNIEIRYEDIQAPLTGTIVTIQIKNPHYA